MNSIIELAQKRIDQFGYYKRLDYEDKTDDYVYFSAYDECGDEVSLRVNIDDEKTFDDWDVESYYEGGTWDFVD